MIKVFVATYLLLFGVTSMVGVKAIITGESVYWLYVIMASIPLGLLGTLGVAMKILKVNFFNDRSD